MSFFYLYATDRSTVDSLYLLNDIFQFARPRFLGLEMSEADFKAKFGAYVKTEEFRNDMKKVEFLIATKKEEELRNFKGTPGSAGFSLPDLHTIYGFQICRTKKCNPVFAGHSQAELESIRAVAARDAGKGEGAGDLEAAL